MAIRMALMPPPPRFLWYDKVHPLHGGIVPDDVLAHLCYIRDILENEPHDPSCDSAFNTLLGKIRAFYMAIHTEKSHAVVKTIGNEAREEFRRFEAFVAHSTFIQDIDQSLHFIAESIIDATLTTYRRLPSQRARKPSLR